VKCPGPEEFVVHCSSNERHKYLQGKFQSNEFDYLFASDIGSIDDDKKAASKMTTGESLLLPSQRI